MPIKIRLGLGLMLGLLLGNMLQAQVMPPLIAPTDPSKKPVNRRLIDSADFDRFGDQNRFAMPTLGPALPPKEQLADLAAQEAAKQAVQANGALKNMKDAVRLSLPQMLETMALQVANQSGQEISAVRTQMQTHALQTQTLLDQMLEIMQPAMAAAMTELAQDPAVLSTYKQFFSANFSAEELNQLVGWYRSPLNQKLLDANARSNQALAAAQLRIINKHMAAIMPSLTAMQTNLLKTIKEEAATPTP